MPPGAPLLLIASQRKLLMKSPSAARPLPSRLRVPAPRLPSPSVHGLLAAVSVAHVAFEPRRWAHWRSPHGLKAIRSPTSFPLQSNRIQLLSILILFVVQLDI